MKFKPVIVTFVAVAMLASACSSHDKDGVPRNATRIQILANESVAPWLNEAAKTLNDGRVKGANNRPVFAEIVPMEVGPALSELSRASSATAMWIPDDESWTESLAGRGNAAFKGDCVSLARSPLVIGMWKDIADALGYPTRTLGWLDISSLTADPQSWAYYTGGQFGKVLRIAHGHPALTASGANTLLAIAQAAKSATAPVNASDLAQPIVKASIGAFEGGVSLFGASPTQLAEAMSQRGADFLGAGVMYESTALTHGEGDIVPVYPVEGTFVATHPGCVNTSASAEQQDAARKYRDALLAEAAQKIAVTHGLRPTHAKVKIGEPLDSEHGVNLAQPSVVFGAATPDVVKAAQDVWQTARKPVNLVMVLDVSGSMAGAKINGLRRAAEQFVNQMGNDDVISIVAFSSAPRVLIENQKIGVGKSAAISAIRGLVANGNTAVFDAVASGAALIAKYNSSQRQNLMVVLTDGLDNASRRKFDTSLVNDAKANGTSLYTIAYGDDANEEQLDSLAKQTNGEFFTGDEANIGEIYQQMSAAFGGNVGVGR